jgi:iron complex transport system ATP-binding protein
MTVALQIDALCYSYGSQKVLTDICFSVSQGAFFMIIGPNGSGKTTLLRSINGLIRTRQGRTEIFGRSLADYDRRRLAQTIAFVPQQISPDIPFTVRDVVLMGRSPYMGILGLEGKKDREIVASAMAFMQVAHLADRRMNQLSGGERQRVLIARAICQEPRIMLLDEPTASLDPGHQIRIMDMMEQLKTHQKITIVMVSHDLNLAGMYADCLLLLGKGRMISIGSPNTVMTYETLEKAYDCVLLVNKSPLGDFPQVVLVPQRFADKRMKNPQAPG